MVPEPAQILWVCKDQRLDPYERITHVGGCRSTTGSWEITQKEAIAHIESHEFRFWVSVGGKSVWVVVAESPSGAKYLKTEGDGSDPDDLLSLPECS
jgi:Protein of unknown function (DUF3892)